MKRTKLTVLQGALLSGTLSAQVPISENRTFSVSEGGPPATGNLLAAPPTIRLYDFDVVGNDGATLDGWVDTVGTTAPSSVVFAAPGVSDGGRGTGGFFNSAGDQDAAHPSAVMSSPAFQLQSGLSISFQIAGGEGTANLPASLAAVPANSTATGFQGFALRRVVNNSYVLHARRAGNGGALQNVGWSIAQLATISSTYPGEFFAVDFVDYYHGSWGFGLVDNVRFTVGVAPGNVALVSPPTLIAGVSGYGGTLEGTLNDPFAYNPLAPAAALPNQGFANGTGFHNNSVDGPVILIYDFAAPVADNSGNQIVVDVYGRNANKERDNNLEVAFLNGSGTVLGQATGLAIPDTGAAHLRISSNGLVPDGSTVTKIRITANDSDTNPAATNNFALLEIRAANLQAAYNGTAPAITAVNGNAAAVGQAVTLPSGAILTLNANGDYIYNPNGAFDPGATPAADSFGFTSNIPGGIASSATASVSILDDDVSVYVDDDWAALANGTAIADADMGTAGNQPATIGTNAFGTLRGGINKAPLGGTITVNAGNYNEAIGLSDGKSLNVTGTNAAQAVTITNLSSAAGSQVVIQGMSVLTLGKGDLGNGVSGSGTLAKTTAGTLTLSVASSLTGPVILDGGTVRLSGTGNLGSGIITVNSATTLQAVGTVTLANPISGAAALTKNGNGILTLSGTSGGYTGLISAATGGLVIPAGSTFGGSVAIATGASLGGEGTITGNLTLGTPGGAASTLNANDATPGVITVNGMLTLNGIVNVGGAAMLGSPINLLTYGTVIENFSGTADLSAAFRPLVGGRSTVVDDSKSLKLTIANTETIVFTASTSDIWQVAGPDNNWNSSDGFFFNGDGVTFDDSVSELFLGTLTITGSPSPSSIVFNNSIAQDYTLMGTPINGATGIVKNNTGIVSLASINNFTGAIVINGGQLKIDSEIRGTAGITVNPGGTFVTSSTNFFVPTHGTAVPATKVISLNDAAWISDPQHDARVGNVVLSNGSTWTSEVGVAAFDALIGPTTAGPAIVTVSGTGASAMVGDGVTGVHLLENVIFNVADTTSSSATDLAVSMVLDDPGNTGGTGGLEKQGPGTMFLSAANTYNGNTVVTAGCLTIEDATAIPNADYTKVSVAAAAGFGGIVGAGNLSDLDVNAIAAGVRWSAGGTAQLVLDTNGASVTVGSSFAGLGFQILAKGGGTLNLTGNVSGVTINTDGNTTVTTTTGPVTQITIGSITTSSGTTAGTRKTSIIFTANTPVDVYASSNLVNWGAPIATNVAAGSSPFVEDNIAASNTKRFYVLVKAGTPYPNTLPN